LRDAVENNVAVLMPGCDWESSKKSVEIANTYPDKPIWSAVGQHPTDTAENWDEDAYRQLAQSPKVVAIGEIGLDYFHVPADAHERDSVIASQKEVLKKQLELAHEVGKPAIIHCRDSHNDLIDILLHQYGIWSGDRERGVIHCFTGTLNDAKSYIDLGFLISFTGIITFTDQYDEIIHALPLEKIMIETDSPFLTPVPYRGKRNHPRYVEYVAKKIAEIRGVSVEDVANATRGNAERLFGVRVI
ncbi:MAG: TatD family hydrolase, partial [Patescibacteria group bacterium]